MSHRTNASNNQTQEDTMRDIGYVIRNMVTTHTDMLNLTVTRVDNDSAIFVVTVRDEDYGRNKYICDQS